MATSDIPQREIEIAKPGDLTVEIIEYGRNSTERRATIRVDKAKLVEHSNYFRNMFRGPWAEGRSDTITLEGDNIKSLEVWFRYVHGNLSEVSYDSVSVASIWHIIMASDKYDFDRKYLATWFTQWYSWKVGEQPIDNNHRFDLRRQLLFPCYSFNYARGFQILTKNIAYEYSEHITEKNPTNIPQMHLPRRVIQQLNAAKGRLRSILHRELFSIIAKILRDASCNCKERTVFNYLRELQRIGVWPLEEAFPKASIKEVLDRMLRFDSTKMEDTNSTPSTSANSTHFTPPARRGSRPNRRFNTQARSNTQPHSCLYCSLDWKKLVTTARSRTLIYFHGLCMTCMADTEDIKLGRDEDEEYWRHNEERDDYDVGCRVSHGQPTWYFSFMGRREKLGQFDQPADVNEED